MFYSFLQIYFFSNIFDIIVITLLRTFFILISCYVFLIFRWTFLIFKRKVSAYSKFLHVLPESIKEGLKIRLQLLFFLKPIFTDYSAHIWHIKNDIGLSFILQIRLGRLPIKFMGRFFLTRDTPVKDWKEYKGLIGSETLWKENGVSYCRRQAYWLPWKRPRKSQLSL